MTTLYVTEFGGAGPQVPIVDTPKVAQNNVNITASSLQSNPFNMNTAVIRVETDSICGVEIGGQNPVATISPQATASQRMQAGDVEYFFVKPGDRIAVIATT
jgi:hypothetical protein